MSTTTSLGMIIKRIRKERRMTLAEMSAICGIALSTLSKIENDKLTLSYDKLHQLSRSLDIPLADFFAEQPSKEGSVTARRSFATLDDAVTIKTGNYVYNYLCTDLRKRLMIPIHTTITAKSLEEFGELSGHDGEEFVYILEGAVHIHTEHYAPSLLNQGEGIYIDSSMRHGYVVAPGFDRAIMLAICASPLEGFEQRLMADAEVRGGQPAVISLAANTKAEPPVKQGRKRKKAA